MPTELGDPDGLQRGAKARPRPRGVVRLSSVDQRRLREGEIQDPYQAVGKPEPRSRHDPDADSSDTGLPELSTDTWLKQNVPPHW